MRNNINVETIFDVGDVAYFIDDNKIKLVKIEDIGIKIMSINEYSHIKDDADILNDKFKVDITYKISNHGKIVKEKFLFKKDIDVLMKVVEDWTGSKKVGE